MSDAEPGVRRRRCGSGWAYRSPDGTPVSARERDRISALAIPPAWRDVWICPLRQGHLQATGRDAKGRKQYRYHDRWREVRDADKFSKLLDFGNRLDAVRKQVDADLAGTAPTRSRILALVVHLLDETLIRVGNEEYAETNESFGLTTLRNKHAAVSGAAVKLRFVGKSGVEHDIELHDRKLAGLVRRCHELGGQELFSYREGDEVGVISSTDVNDWLHQVVGPDTSAKTFRTWGASAVVVEQLATAETRVGRQRRQPTDPLGHRCRRRATSQHPRHLPPVVRPPRGAGRISGRLVGRQLGAQPRRSTSHQAGADALLRTLDR